MTKSELIQHLRALRVLGKHQVTVDVESLLKILEQQPDNQVVRQKKPRGVALDAGTFGDHLE